MLCVSHRMRAEQESHMREIEESMEAQRREYESHIRELGAQMVCLNYILYLPLFCLEHV